MAPPSSQKHRPIGFTLTDQSTGDVISQHDLVIRPEDLTRFAPSRLAAIQTLGGAWVDDFGPGLAVIQISGHTGWRGANGRDGLQLFQDLHDTAFNEWHTRRQSAIDGGRSPDTIQLLFSDALDGFVNGVAPQSFTLKRSRSRPLLAMYQISMIVVDERLEESLRIRVPAASRDVSAKPANDPDAGLESLDDTLTNLQDMRSTAPEWVDPDLVAPVQSVMGVGNTAISKVVDAVGSARSAIAVDAAPLVSAARDLALVARNAFYNIAAVVDAVDSVAFRIARAASLYQNAVCVLSNAFAPTRLFPDYSRLFGASSCSSTNGGSPLSPLRFSNPFESIVPSIAAPVAIGSVARLNMAALMTGDPVLAPLSRADLAQRLASIGGGVAFR